MEKDFLSLMNKVSMVVCSCDRYEDAWYPFFRLIRQNFPDHPKKVYLLSNEKSYDYGDLGIINVHSPVDQPWSERLRNALQNIDSEYVLFSLEDYFVFSNVDRIGYQKAIKKMEEKPEWGGIWFPPLRKGKDYPVEYNWDKAFSVTDHLKKGRTNMGIILYRSSFLKKLLVGTEDAWRFESESNIRSLFAGYEVVHYDINASKPIFFYYQKFIDGVGITSRKWLDKTHEVFEMNGIFDVAFDRLGVIRPEEAYSDPTDKRTTSKRKLSLHDWGYYYIKRPIKNSKPMIIARGLYYYLRYYS